MKYSFDEVNHIHSVDGKPLMGTSTVVGVISKPLTYWAAGLAVAELGWSPINGKDKKVIAKEIRLPIAAKKFSLIKELSDDDYLKLLDKAYKAHAQKLKTTAADGTDMHAELEKYVKMTIEKHNGEPIATWQAEHPAVKLFADWAFKNVSKFLVSEGYCYSEKLWTGGIVDLVFEDKQKKLGIMDFKSSKEAYLSQFLQIAGYDIAISENGVFDKEGDLLLKPNEISYYAVFPFGMEKPEPQFHYDTKGAQEGFKSAVVLYKLINK